MSPSDDTPDSGLKDSVPLSLALNIMDAFVKAGMVVVPRNPTEKMVAAGAKVCCENTEKAKEVYEAMITAAE
ncbi:MAG: hypothetical protein OEY85_13615 [Rhodospirillales bacterium]|nr:hypothetical protein [Rhodospirillales bacterium]